MHADHSYNQIALQHLYTTGGSFVKQMLIGDGKIKTISTNDFQSSNKKDTLRFQFDNALVFPGLINSHDHLDFNLFPKLGNRTYKNYLEWGTDIHHQNKKTIDEVLKVPQALRIQWGIYKNLLNGFTTVFNHGKQLQIQHSLIDIFQDKDSSHSVRLEKYWKLKLNNPFNKKQPFVIHIGEGTDEKSCKEVDTLLQWNILRKKLIGIHGVAMNIKQAAHVEALVWCPDSNFFLLNATAAIDKLKHVTSIIFGTDSTVSADWNFWNHLRLARKIALLNDVELFASLTSLPAKVRNLSNIGMLEENANADIVIAEKNSDNATEAFYALNPESILMIIKNGSIILFDESLLQQVVDQNISATMFSRIHVNGKFKYVKGELHQLIKHIKSYSKEIHLPVEPA